MKRLNLCIDIDGTITEPYYWISRVNEYFNTHLEPEDAIHYEIHKILGVNPEAYSQFYKEYGELLHKEAKIRFGAAMAIKDLHSIHRIHFVTAREEKMKQVTLDWLSDHKIPMHSLSLLGSHDKIHKAEELKSDLFIEDRYENAIQLSQAGFEVLLIDCNYNRGALPANVTRVKHWFQIGAIIEQYAQQYDELKVAL
ncbi:5' nucleotidase, NT5C type [Clostridium aminobutyricum]|uniref:Nucleotidase n=1 Tax=Clostridium aminobutyricum TaxID=33953 RepID=A0A939D7T7_CLOAM|nr:hypothetical protein [Clostridium aminobutyricum]MBN7772802.1 hypothetical protein [Clostridium aminobutyricum]